MKNRYLGIFCENLERKFYYFLGGWLNETIIEDYIYYARTLFDLYGDRVKHWITFNEPHQTCEQGYSTGEKAPFKKMQGTADYLCYHHMAISHGRIYRIYETDYKPTQKGERQNYTCI